MSCIKNKKKVLACTLVLGIELYHSCPLQGPPTNKRIRHPSLCHLCTTFALLHNTINVNLKSIYIHNRNATDRMNKLCTAILTTKTILIFRAGRGQSRSCLLHISLLSRSLSIRRPRLQVTLFLFPLTM